MDGLMEDIIDVLVGGAITIVKNDGIRQWEGWRPFFIMENNKCLKPPTRMDLGLLYIQKTPCIIISPLLPGEWLVNAFNLEGIHGFVWNKWRTSAKKTHSIQRFIMASTQGLSTHLTAIKP